MAFMFYNASKFNQPLYDWNVRSVIRHTEFENGSALIKENLPKWKK